MYIYIYPPPCLVHEGECTGSMSGPGTGPVWVPWALFLIDFKGPHPRLPASGCVHRTPHFSMKNSITFPCRFFNDF